MRLHMSFLNNKGRIIDNQDLKIDEEMRFPVLDNNESETSWPYEYIYLESAFMQMIGRFTAKAKPNCSSFFIVPLYTSASS